MSWKFWIKVQGATEPTFAPVNTLSIEIPIFGMHPTFEEESSSQVSMSGVEIGQSRIRVKLNIDCVPFSTWDSGTVSTETTMYLLTEILTKKHRRIIAPSPGLDDKKLPDRYRDSVNFPITTGLLSSGFEFARHELTNEQKWASGLEQISLTVYRKELLS
jgi:hypothetical protein